MMSYNAIIEYDKEDQVYNVEFPDLPGCLTYGKTLEEAQKMAKEALTGYLESIDSRKIKIPEPSKNRGKNVYAIEPDKGVAFAIWLKKMRESRGMSQTEVADKLGIKYQTYQRFENPSKANPTLKTLLKLEAVFHTDLLHT